MNTRTLRVLAFCAMLGTLAAPCPAASPPATDGLVPVKVKNHDEAWQRPGATFKGYTSVMIRPVTVQFSKNWRAREHGPYGPKPGDLERIRANFAQIAADTFAGVLSRGGYSVAESPAGNVLDVQLEVVDLYLNGPDFDPDVFARTYVRSFGDIRLVVTLRDSVSGTVLFRSTDYRRGEETGHLEWANSVYNRSQAQRAFSGWARQLQRLLED